MPGCAQSGDALLFFAQGAPVADLPHESVRKHADKHESYEIVSRWGFERWQNDIGEIAEGTISLGGPRKCLLSSKRALPTPVLEHTEEAEQNA